MATQTPSVSSIPSSPSKSPKQQNAFDAIDLSAAPMATSEVEHRLDALHEIDKKIIKLLGLAADAVETLKEGKMGGSDAKPPSDASDASDPTSARKEPFNPQQTRTKFAEQTRSYYTTLEETSVAIRREIRLLNDASGSKVMPISVVPKASGVGRAKEEQIWKSISEKKQDTDPSPLPTPQQDQNQQDQQDQQQQQETQQDDKMDIDMDEKDTKESTLGGLAVTDKEDELGKLKVVVKESR